MLAELFGLLLSFFERRSSATDASTFYKSKEWKRLRYAALKEYGARCMACGSTPAHGVRIVVDHITSVRTHPHLRLFMSNLQVLCDSCNRGKGFKCQKDWRARR